MKTLEIVPAENAAPVALRSEPLLSTKGRVLGDRIYFGAQTAAELKEYYKGTGLKGNALKAKVNTALCDEKSRRRVALAVFAEAADAKGLVPEFGDLKDNAATVKWVAAGADNFAKDKLEAAQKELDAAKAQIEAQSSLNEKMAAKMGVTVEQLLAGEF